MRDSKTSYSFPEQPDATAGGAAPAYYFSPARDADWGGTIYRHAPDSPGGREFICECTAEDAPWIIAALTEYGNKRHKEL